MSVLHFSWPLNSLISGLTSDLNAPVCDCPNKGTTIIMFSEVLRSVLKVDLKIRLQSAERWMFYAPDLKKHI